MERKHIHYRDVCFDSVYRIGKYTNVCLNDHNYGEPITLSFYVSDSDVRRILVEGFNCDDELFEAFRELGSCGNSFSVERVTHPLLLKRIAGELIERNACVD